jgi:hypothetical protein
VRPARYSLEGLPSREHLFDTERVARPVLNVEQPPSIPQRPMGSIPVVIRLVRPDGEEWWPGTANRWTDTHVLVHWVEDHHYEFGVATRRGRPPIPEDLARGHGRFHGPARSGPPRVRFRLRREDGS